MTVTEPDTPAVAEAVSGPPAAETDDQTDAAENGVGDVVEDVLVEEISIDGMCGVY